MIRWRRLGTWLLASVAGLVLLAALLFGWLLGTESGTRFLVARGADYLPPSITLGDASGTLLGRVELDGISLRLPGVDADLAGLGIELRLKPLLRGSLVIETLDLAAASLRLSSADTPASDEPFELAFRSPLGIELREARLDAIGIRLADGSEYDIDRIELAGRLRGDELRLQSLRLRSGMADIDLGGRLRLTTALPATLAARWRLRLPAQPEFAGALSLDGDRAGWALEHELAEPFAISTSGVVALADSGPAVELLSRWTELAWPPAKLRTGPGSLGLEGTPRSLAIRLDTDAQYADYPSAELALDAQLDDGTLHIASLSAASALGKARASGSVDIGTRRTDLAVSASGLDPGLIDERLAGELSLEARLDALPGEAPEIEVSGIRVAGRLNDQPLEASGELRYAHGELSFTDTRVQLGDNRLAADGAWGSDSRLAVDAKLGDLGDILPGLAGSVNGRLVAAGSPQAPRLELEARLAGVEASGIGVDEGDISLRIEPDQSGSARIEANGLSYGEVTVARLQLQGDGSLPSHTLTLTAEREGLAAELALGGALHESTWDATVTSLLLDSEPHGRWRNDGAFSLALMPGQWRVDESCLVADDHAARLCTRADGGSDRPLSATADIRDLPLSVFAFLQPDYLQADGRLNAQAEASWGNSRLNANASVAVEDGALRSRIDDEEMEFRTEQARLDVEVVDNRLQSLAVLRLADGAGEVTARLGMAELLSPTTSAVSGSAELSLLLDGLLPVLVPELRDPEGRLSGELELAGTVAEPLLRGSIGIDDGAVTLSRLGIRLSEMDLRMTQTAPGELDIRGSARSGEGVVELRGRSYFESPMNARAEFTLKGDQVDVLRLPDWQLAASPDMTLVLDERTATLSGRLSIPSADIRVRDIPPSAQQASPDAVVHGSEAAAPVNRREIVVDLRTELGDEVSLQGFGLTTGLTGALQLKGGSQRAYTGQGTLSLVGGRYKAYGQELDIRRGDLIFNGPLDSPELDVQAVRQVDNVIAGIHLTGTPGRLRSTVYSEPPMSDAEALSYLIAGRPLSGISSDGDGDLLNQAAFALGLSGAGAITSRIRTQLGLETLTIEGGREDSRLIAGKRFGERLMVEYGYGLVDRLGTLLLRYRLSQRLTLESRTGGVSTLDLVYTVRKRD